MLKRTCKCTCMLLVWKGGLYMWLYKAFLNCCCNIEYHTFYPTFCRSRPLPVASATTPRKWPTPAPPTTSRWFTHRSPANSPSCSWPSRRLRTRKDWSSATSREETTLRAISLLASDQEVRWGYIRGYLNERGYMMWFWWMMCDFKRERYHCWYSTIWYWCGYMWVDIVNGCGYIMWLYYVPLANRYKRISVYSQFFFRIRSGNIFDIMYSEIT